MIEPQRGEVEFVVAGDRLDNAELRRVDVAALVRKRHQLLADERGGDLGVGGVEPCDGARSGDDDAGLPRCAALEDHAAGEIRPQLHGLRGDRREAGGAGNRDLIGPPVVAPSRRTVPRA